MPEDMEYPNIATKNRTEFAAVDMSTIPGDIATLQGDVITLDGRTDNAVISLNNATVGTYVTGLESTETGDGNIAIFTFPGLTGPFVANTETVDSLGVTQTRTVQYTILANVVTFEAAFKPASGKVYLSGMLPITWAF
jgi:hypothetical protein